MTTTKRTLPADRSEWTPEETKTFLRFYAEVLAREAAARASNQCEFSAELQSWSDKARREADAIDLRPPQMELF
ncbi:hypothetical protein [Shinella zoogloeoides]|uniref:hypothetical protein n=1 Tax=Shinella zoogloeoides TaxID=352475 RepID=UPI00299DE8D6|nr:hypothetical protein [Shinella zoogloeoides]